MAINAVQREINETLKKHPTWSRIQALHWNRRNNQHTIARHKREAARSKRTEREQKTLKKAMNFAN